MVPTLGIHVSGDTAYLSIVHDGEVQEVKPYTMLLSEGLDSGQQLTAFVIEFQKVLSMHSVETINILEPEANTNATYKSHLPRITIETLIRVASAESGIGCHKITRQRVRSVLKLPRSGSVSAHLKALVPAKGPHWNGKRDLATAAALTRVSA